VSNERRASWPGYVLVLAVALALRLVMIASLMHGDVRQWFFSQATEIGCFADSILAGHGMSSPFGGETGPSAFLAPGYPALVALLFHVFGAYSNGAAIALLVLHILAAMLTVLVVMLVAQRAFNAKTAIVAGMLCAVSPPLVWLPVLFWESCLSTLLLIGFLALALRIAAQPRMSLWLAMGAWGAVAMLINPSLTLALVSMALWAAWQRRGLLHGAAALRGPAAAAILWMVLFAPWPIRNARVMHAFVPLRDNMGYELWQGNRVGSDGNFAKTEHPNGSRTEYARYKSLGEMAYMRDRSAVAMQAIEADPARFVVLTMKRVARFWMGRGGRKSLGLITAWVTATTLLGFAGLVLLLRRRRELGILFAMPVLLFPLPYYITHADFRFRFVLEPLMLLLSAYAGQTWVMRKKN
jgi:4-amino-4-deoxy-L-arabinose transferase-like glycosyltransferase